jgi:vacuolar-type H+-ATPase subunit D/Vma8
MTPENELKTEQIKNALIRAYEAFCNGHIWEGKAAVEEAQIISKALDVRIEQVSRAVR